MFEWCIPGIENFDQIARKLTKLKPNDFFNDFAISRDTIDRPTINYFFTYFKNIAYDMI